MLPSTSRAEAIWSMCLYAMCEKCPTQVQWPARSARRLQLNDWPVCCGLCWLAVHVCRETSALQSVLRSPIHHCDGRLWDRRTLQRNGDAVEQSERADESPSRPEDTITRTRPYSVASQVNPRVNTSLYCGNRVGYGTPYCVVTSDHNAAPGCATCILLSEAESLFRRPSGSWSSLNPQSRQPWTSRCSSCSR